MPYTSTPRNYGLDILRSLAIFFVLNIHSAQFFRKDVSLFNFLVFLNLDGVSLFFVLSGFLIGGILIRTFESERASFRLLLLFWKRRWFRTLPNYLLILTFLVFCGYFTGTIPENAPVKSYYFFTANFITPLPDYLFPEAWSLSVEEWFYIFIPTALFVLIRFAAVRTQYAVLTVSAIVIIFVTFFRYYHIQPSLGYKQVDPFFRKQVITRLDSLMFGVIGAYVSFYHQTSWQKIRKGLLFIGVFLLYFPYVQRFTGVFGLTYVCVFSYTIQSVGFLCLFPMATSVKTGKGRVYHIVTIVSKLSYSLYLVNYSIVKGYLIPLLTHALPVIFDSSFKAVTNYLLFWTLTLSVGYLLYKYFEKPLMDLRNVF